MKEKTGVDSFDSSLGYEGRNHGHPKSLGRSGYDVGDRVEDWCYFWVREGTREFNGTRDVFRSDSLFGKA